MTKKIKSLFIVFIALLSFNSCKNSLKYEYIDPKDFQKNEKEILSFVHDQYYETEQYKNSIKPAMAGTFICDRLIVMSLNSNEQTRNDRDKNSTTEYKQKWEGKVNWTIDAEDILAMKKNNTPIIQLSFHFVDLKSLDGANYWYTNTYFFPNAKQNGSKIELGNFYMTNNYVPGFNYFPYKISLLDPSEYKSMIAYDGPYDFLNIENEDNRKINILFDQKINSINSIFYNSTSNNSKIDSIEVKPNSNTSQIIPNESSINEKNNGTFQIVVEKSYFYKDASFKNRRKAYIINGQGGNYERIENNFILATFINDEGIETKGWISTNDVNLN
jgi:hypothetical protein